MRTSEVYPDKLRKAMLAGPIDQMKADCRAGCSFQAGRSISAEVDEPDDAGVDEVNWPASNADPERRLELARKDCRATRLMLPGTSGPAWSSCVERATVDLDAGQLIEDRGADLIAGRERRRQFIGDLRGISATFACVAIGEVGPRKWSCPSCGHSGRLNAPGTCAACGEFGKVWTVKLEDAPAVHREAGGWAYAGGDSTGDDWTQYLP